MVDHLGVEDNLPCADYGLLVPLKRSREYRGIRKRVVDLRPADAWQQEGFHFFVFILRTAGSPDAAPPEPPVAVFAMHPDATEPVSAVVVTPSADGADAEISNVRDPAGAYTASMSN